MTAEIGTEMSNVFTLTPFTNKKDGDTIFAQNDKNFYYTELSNSEKIVLVFLRFIVKIID